MNNRKRQQYSRHILRRYKKKKLWGLSYYLSNDLQQILRLFKKENQHSYPANFTSHEQWHEALDKMIWSFQQIASDYPGPMLQAISQSNQEYKLTRGDDGSRIIEFIHPSPITEEVIHQEEEYNARIQDGLDLFAKYFHDLWD